MGRRERWIALGLVVALLAGCAAPGPTLPGLRRGEPVVLTVRDATAETPPALLNEEASRGTVQGARTGAAAGALAGMTCGPYALFCIPVAMVAGMLPGTVIGAMAGAAAALPDDKARQLRERVKRVSQANDLVGQLRATLLDRGGRVWALTEPDATGRAHRVEAEMLALELSSVRGERVYLTLRVQVRVWPAGSAAGAAPRSKRFEITGPEYPLAAWLDDSSDVLETSLSTTLQQATAQILAELEAR